MAGAPPGLPPGLPPPGVPGLTSSPPGQSPGGMMPSDNLGAALQGLKNRKGSATELMRNAVLMLETAASLDDMLSDRVGAALALLRGPAKPADKGDSNAR